MFLKTYGTAMEKTCVLIPSYNEAKTIGGIVKLLVGRGLTVYVVDDGSVDNTASEASRQGAKVIRNSKNMGKGAALRKGFEGILAGVYDSVIIMDGDDQHDVTDIAHLIKKMRETGAGIVIGNRMLDTSSMPYIRIAVNSLMSNIISKLAGQYMPDTQCGFRLIRREVLERIVLRSDRYEIESEMILKAAKKGFRIESIPVKTVYKGQKSKINPVFDTIRFIAFLIRLFFER